MPPTVFTPACLALCAVLLALAAQESDAAESKVFTCCQKVSTQRTKAPILGYRIQKKDLPCVNAVIFNTTEGEFCVYWGLGWVKAKIQELQAAKKISATTTQ